MRFAYVPRVVVYEMVTEFGYWRLRFSRSWLGWHLSWVRQQFSLAVRESLYPAELRLRRLFHLLSRLVRT